MIDLNLNPTPRQLRRFGVISAIVVPAIVFLLYGGPTTDGSASQTRLIVGLTTFCILTGLLGWFRPAMLKPIFLATMIVSYPIGLIVSELALLTIFLLVFTPFALVFRLIGRDALDRTIDPNADSYWQPKEQPKDATSYYRQS